MLRRLEKLCNERSLASSPDADHVTINTRDMGRARDLIRSSHENALFRFILEPPPEINISPEMPVDDYMRSATKLLRLNMRRVARLDIVLPPSILLAVWPYLWHRAGPKLQSLSIRTSSHMGQQRIRLPSSPLGQLMHGKKLFPVVEQVAFETAAPCILDPIWEGVHSVELTNLTPAWIMEDYLDVIRKSRNLTELKIVGSMPITLRASWENLAQVNGNDVRTLHLSGCSTAEVAYFFSHVHLPQLFELTVAPSTVSEGFSNFYQLFDEGAAYPSVMSFQKVRDVELMCSAGRDNQEVPCISATTVDDGVFTITFPDADPSVFRNTMDLFPNAIRLSLHESCFILRWDWPHRYPIPVQTLRLSGTIGINGLLDQLAEWNFHYLRYVQVESCTFNELSRRALEDFMSEVGADNPNRMVHFRLIKCKDITVRDSSLQCENTRLHIAD